MHLRPRHLSLGQILVRGVAGIGIGVEPVNRQIGGKDLPAYAQIIAFAQLAGANAGHSHVNIIEMAVAFKSVKE